MEVKDNEKICTLKNQCVIFVPQKIAIRLFEKSKSLESVFMFFHLCGFEESCLHRVTQKVTCFHQYIVNNLLPVTQWLLPNFRWQHVTPWCYPICWIYVINTQQLLLQHISQHMKPIISKGHSSAFFGFFFTKKFF